MSEERDRLAEEFEKNINYIFGQPTNVEVEAAFCAGFDAGVESEKKRAQGLVEAIRSAIHERFEDEDYMAEGFVEFYQNHFLVKALAAYKQEIGENK